MSGAYQSVFFLSSLNRGLLFHLLLWSCLMPTANVTDIIIILTISHISIISISCYHYSDWCYSSFALCPSLSPSLNPTDQGRLNQLC